MTYNTYYITLVYYAKKEYYGTESEPIAFSSMCSKVDCTGARE